MADTKLTKSRLEALLALATGSVAQPASGLAGLYALARGKDGAKAVADTQQALTYAPRDARGLREIASAIDPVTSRLEGLKHYLGDKAERHGASPLGATAAYMVPDTLLTLLGARGMGVKGPKLAELVQGTRELPSMGSARSQIGAINAWHGSPHDFDRFSLDHLGTGEGNQSYGHGLYFADNPEVAKVYQQSADWRQKTSDQMNYMVDGAKITPKGIEDGLLYHYRLSSPELFEQRLNMLKGDHESSLQMAERYHQQSQSGEDAERYARMAARSRQTASEIAEQIALGERLRHANVAPANGRLYNVELAPDEADLLDWDAPLSQQPEKVRAALEKGFGRHPTRGPAIRGESPKHMEYTGAALHEGLAQQIGGREAVAEVLRNLGIPGIRYLDGGSRAAGDGSRNYVMFDDSLVNIKGKE